MKQIAAFKANTERKSAVMMGMSMPMSDEDARNVARHGALLAGLPTEQPLLLQAGDASRAPWPMTWVNWFNP